jgi:hypothetical protein
MPTFNAGDVIGKTLIAKRNIPLFRQPADDAQVIYNVSPGQSVGNVDTFLLPNENRSSLYWSFKDANGKNYYAKHAVGIYDVKELQQQGLLTLQEQQAAEIEASLSTGDKIFRLIKNIALIGAGVYLLKEVISKKLK